MRGTLEGAARGFEQLAHSLEIGWQAVALGLLLRGKGAIS
jgi:hypothetical protein